MKLWQVLLAILVGLPLTMFIIYAVARIVSAAIFRSWWEEKLEALGIKSKKEVKNGRDKGYS